MRMCPGIPAHLNSTHRTPPLTWLLIFIKPHKGVSKSHQGSKLYCVNDSDYTLEMVTLDMMSEPKVVAYDEDVLWFLNVNA